MSLWGDAQRVGILYTRTCPKNSPCRHSDLTSRPEIAERAATGARNGPVTSAFCASASSAILRQILDLKDWSDHAPTGWPPISQKSGAFVNKII